MLSELHLLIIWERGRYKQNEIIEDMRLKFKIISVYEIEWSDDLVSSNFTRFYGVNLPSGSAKEIECGRGKFLLVILLDEHPIYRMRPTSRGKECANINMFDAKTIYRAWTDGGHKIHATNSPKEANHDLTLLLGVNSADFLKKKSSEWNGVIEPLSKDLEGSRGWASLETLFYVLNNTVDYVVMRGDDNLLSGEAAVEHGDIDILVKNWKNIVYVINGDESYFVSPCRPRVLVRIKSDEYLFDIWRADLPYHSSEWHNEMFNTKVLNGLYYRLNAENSFYSLLYHCLVHKTHTSPDYLPFFKQKFYELKLYKNYSFDGFKYPMDLYYKILLSYMETHNYQFLHPIEDTHCFFRECIPKIKLAENFLMQKAELSNVRPYCVDSFTFSGYLYFTAELDGKKIFIKYGGLDGTCDNEYCFAKKISDIDSAHFLKPIAYEEASAGNNGFIAFEFIESDNFIDYALAADEEKKNDIKQQILEIYKSLQKSAIIHRDIRPENLIVTDGRLILIDFQFARSTTDYSELSVLKSKENLSLRIGLGGECRYKSWAWNDSYSLRKCLEKVGIKISKKEFIPSARTVVSFTIIAYKVKLKIKRLIPKPIKRFIKVLLSPRQNARKFVGKVKAALKLALPKRVKLILKVLFFSSP